MTKRTVEQAVRDDLAAAEDEVAKKVGLVEKARVRYHEASNVVATATRDVEEAEARVIRARNALAAITGRSLDELIEETKARAATTGTHDPADLAECPTGCGSAETLELSVDWRDAVQAGEKIAIVGCGNPWHYVVAGERLDVAPTSPPVVSPLRKGARR